MFARKHGSEHSTNRLAAVRDVVEIVAILAAGLWAMYVFIYENRIKPALLEPTVSVTATMEALGHDRGLTAVRLDTHIVNVGTVRARFLAYSVTVLGSQVNAVAAPKSSRPRASDFDFARDYTLSRPEVVYRHAYLTHTADPKITADLFLGAGGAGENTVVFYVPTRKYDRLSAVFVGSFTNRPDAAIPTSMRIGSDGLPQLSGDQHDITVDSEPVATLSLWPK